MTCTQRDPNLSTVNKSVHTVRTSLQQYNMNTLLKYYLFDINHTAVKRYVAHTKCLISRYLYRVPTLLKRGKSQCIEHKINRSQLPVSVVKEYVKRVFRSGRRSFIAHSDGAFPSQLMLYCVRLEAICLLQCLYRQNTGIVCHVQLHTQLATLHPLPLIDN